MSMIVNPYIFGGGGGVGPSPSDSDIVITGNAEIEVSGGHIFGFSGPLTSGVTGAHGRVYNNATFQATFDYPVADREFVSAGCRFLFRVDATSGQMFRFVRDPNSTQVSQIGIFRAAGGVLRVSKFVLAGPTTNYDSGSSNIALDTWYYCTLYARIHDTLGEFIAKLYDASGALIETLTQTGIDTRNGSSATLADATYWGSGDGDTYVDHLWTDVNGAMRGCGYVENLQPVANGDTIQFTRFGTDTGANWSQVSELPSSDTQRVNSTAAGQIDLYKFAARAAGGTLVGGPQQIVVGNNVTTNTGKTWRAVCKVGGTIYQHGETHAFTTLSAAGTRVIRWPNNPATGNAWTDADLGPTGAQFGIEADSGDIRFHAVSLHALANIE